ncbi:MAG TPA: rod shape-determining protein MreD [Streptosporangiaceae bacterium]|nr:rod shape-determining protein MreD [Streptosporangiaceae bacterium]
MLRRAALSGGLLLIAILIQLTILDNLRLPGGAGPDLVLVVVVAVGLTGGPVEGMLGGFCAGLALDVAPPATHLVGQYALVFCLVGYSCGRLRVSLDHSAWAPIVVVAVGSAAGELLYALTGMIFGDPDITWTAIRQVLPASVLYDVLLSPFVLYAVARVQGIAIQGLAALRGGDAPALLTPGLAAAAGLLGTSGAVVRDSGTGRAPRLSARSLRAGSTQGGSASGGRAPARPPGRPVQLRFGGAGAMQGGSASSPRIPRQLPARPVSLRLGTRNWASRYRNGLPARPVSLRLGTRNWASRYRGRSLASAGSGLLGDGGGGRALRPGRGPRLRGSVMQGGSASGTRVSLTRPARPVHLRLGGSARRRDGAIGGSVLGRGPHGRSGTAGRGFSGRAFGNKSALGSRRPAVGKTHVPRFRGVKSAALTGRRGPRAAPGRGTFGRHRPIWRMFSKRTGGLG